MNDVRIENEKCKIENVKLKDDFFLQITEYKLKV